MAGRRRSPARPIAVTILVAATAIAIVRLATPIADPATRSPAEKPAAVPVHALAPTPPVPSPPVAANPDAIHRIIDTGGPIRYGQWFWDDTHAAGPITITVDVKASVLSVFRGGDEIGTTAVIYGADDRETPIGTFPILEKDRHHVSNLYHAPMPYMLRLTRDGISIHASEVAADYATHGCIGVPADFAKKLFETASVGDRVIITDTGMQTS